MLADTHPNHEWFQLFSEPSDFGFSGLARRRTWVIGAHRDLTIIKEDPFEVLGAIREACSTPDFQSSITDYLVASKNDILLEASEVALRRNIRFVPDQMNLEYLLSERESKTAKQLDGRYQVQYQSHPWQNPQLVYYLGDNASFGSSWSACSGKIPTFRCNSSHGLYWMPSNHRWITSRERLTAMGWPCVPETARSMQVPLFGARDPKRASDLVGNAMHWQSAGIMQLISLVCFGPANL